MQVLATPIISVAISPKTNAPERAESEEDASSSGVHVSAPPGGLLGLSSGMRPMAGPGAFGSFPKPEKRRQLAYAHFDDGANEVRPEPPAGIIEGVTFVEPRAVPSNGSDLDSVILGPGVHGQAVKRRSETRNAPTVRTRVRLRGADSEPPPNSAPTRRSATLLAALIAIALLLTGVSALFRSQTPSAANQPSEEDAAPKPLAPEHARVDVQAASPQPTPENANSASPENVNSASPASAPEVVAIEAEPAPALPAPTVAPEVVRTSLLAHPARPSTAPRGASKHAADSQLEVSARVARASAVTSSASRPSATPSEGKSWIKVRE